MSRVRVARVVLFVGLGVLGVQGQGTPAVAQSGVVDPALGIRTVELWPGGAPGAKGTEPGDVPAVSVFTPRRGKSNGTAVVIAPGGAYLGLASDLEGSEVAEWFAARGIAAFVLRYRLGAKYLYPIPLQDAQRAVRFVRANAAKYGVDPGRVGMMGFSAGGHLAAMESVSADTADANAADVVDRASSKPDFVVLGYPWLNAMQPNEAGLITYCSVIKAVPRESCSGFETQYSPVKHVTSATPPTFIYITSDDQTVDVDSSVEYFRALRAAKVPVEFHSFAHGAHGSGLGSGDPALDLWPTLLDAWLRGRGLLGVAR